MPVHPTRLQNKPLRPHLPRLTMVHRRCVLLLLVCALASASCTTTPRAKKQAQVPAKTAAWSPSDFDIFVEVTADKVLVNGTEVASHDSSRLDEDIERRHAAGLLVVPIARGVSDAAKSAPQNLSLAVAVEPEVSSQVLTTVAYSAPGSLSEISTYVLIVGDTPPVVVEEPQFGRLMQAEKLDAPPMLTLSPTWRTMRLAAFMKVARLGDCAVDDTCKEREQTRRKWALDARKLARSDQSAKASAFLRKLAASYELERAHAGLRSAAERAEELNGHRPRFLQVSLKGDLPVSLYPELFALRCRNWTPDLVEQAAKKGQWSCDKMVDSIVVNIVR